jgi:hypothetical protein
MATIEQGNGFDPTTETPSKRAVALELSLPEAEALRAWLLTATNDGKTALDDSLVKAATMKLGASIDLISAVVKVREELEAAGFDTADMTDEKVEALGRKISETSLHRLN